MRDGGGLVGGFRACCRNPDASPGPDFIPLSPGKDWAEYGELKRFFAEEDDLEPFLPKGAEEDWRDLDGEEPEQKTDAEWFDLAGQKRKKTDTK